MHEAALAQAALPAHVEVLGLRLRPYSIGHELFLRREGVLEKDGPWNIADLAKAAVICSNTWRENITCHRDRLLRLKLAIWRFRVLRHVIRKPLLLTLHSARFADYYAAGIAEFRMSEIATRETPPRLPGSPFLLRLIQFLITKLHLTESQAMDYPLGLAKMQYQCFYETKGCCDVYNAHEADFDRYCSEMDAKAERGLQSAARDRN